MICYQKDPICCYCDKMRKRDFLFSKPFKDQICKKMSFLLILINDLETFCNIIKIKLTRSLPV
jgi:thioredoxin-related protein